MEKQEPKFKLTEYFFGNTYEDYVYWHQKSILLLNPHPPNRNYNTKYAHQETNKYESRKFGSFNCPS